MYGWPRVLCHASRVNFPSLDSCFPWPCLGLDVRRTRFHGLYRSCLLLIACQLVPINHFTSSSISEHSVPHQPCNSPRPFSSPCWLPCRPWLRISPPLSWMSYRPTSLMPPASLLTSLPASKTLQAASPKALHPQVEHWRPVSPISVLQLPQMMLPSLHSSL